MNPQDRQLNGEVAATRGRDLTNVQKRLIPRPFIRRYYVLTLVILMAGFILTVSAFVAVRKQEHLAAEEEFVREAVGEVGAVSEGFDQSIQLVRSLEAHFKATDRVTATGFSAFVQPLLSHYPGVQALEWIPLVTDNTRSMCEEAAQRDFPGFQITERKGQGSMVRAGSRPEYFPVYFVEPYATNEAALGFDLASNPARREALTRARDSGDIVVTARVVLVQEKVGQYGFLVFDPLYRKGARLDTPEQKRANLVGFVLGVFRIPDVVETAIRNHKRAGLDLSLYDESAEQKDGFLYRHLAERPGREKEGSSPAAAGLVHTAKLEIGGRTWLLRVTPGPEQHVPYTSRAWLVLLGGITLTVVLAAYAQSIRRHSEALITANEVLATSEGMRQGLEAELRDSEERLRMATEAARIGVWDWDVINDQQIWSDVYKALLGLPPDSPANFEVLMNSVHPDDWDTMMPAINKAMQEKRGYTLEYRALWPDRSLHWQVAKGHAFYDDTGQPTRMTGVSIDIDKRKLAEQRLHLQSAALEAAANSIVITDPKGTILWTNPAFSRLTGYAAEEARGRNPNLLKSGKQDKTLYANLWKTITSGNIWHGEIINRRKDGTLYTEEMTVTPVRGDSGEISHYVAIKQDITERKNVDKQLRESEASFRLLFMNNPQPMWVYDLKTLEFLEVNDAAISHYGYSRDEFLRMRIIDIRPEEDLPRLLESVRKGQSELQHSGHWRHRLKDGRIINVEITSHVLQFAGRDAKLVVANDVTERKQAEEALRQSEERFRQAFEGSPVGIVLVGLDYRIFQVNRTLCEMLGYSEQELIGRRPADLTHPEDADLGAKLVEEVLKGEISHQQFEKRYLKKNAQVFWAQLDVTLIYDATGKPVCALEMIVDVTERKRAEEELYRSRQMLQSTLDTIPQRVFWKDRNSTYLGCNQTFATDAGLNNPAEIVGKNDFELAWSGTAERYRADDKLVMEKGSAKLNFDETQTRPDGRLLWLRTNKLPMRDREGKVTGVIGTYEDITERKRAEEALRQAEEKYRRIFEDVVVGIFQTTPEGRYLSVNPALARMYGYDSPEQLMTEVTDIASQVFVEPNHYREMTRLLEQHGVASNVESEVHCKDGSKKWVLANVRAVLEADGKIVRREGTIQDITERKAAEKQIQFLAYYDALTGLPNRTLFQDRLAKALASARRRREMVALLFLDLDRFKTINDSLGHSVGDLFLKEVAERLKKVAREQDTVARLGGDEFVVVLTAVKDPADAAVAADRLMKEMTTAFVVQEHSLSVTCSIGISVFPDHGTDGEILLKNADSAMYSAKEDGNSIQFFTQDMNARAVERLTLENSLRLALRREELFLVYQPQVELATGQIIGAEALLRWRHPELGLVPPNKFIPIAENSGLIIPIGEWVLRTACAQARQWQDEGLPALPVAVNVSAVQFRQESFFRVVEKVLHETGLPPQYLELELTESVLLSNSDVMLSVLRKLKDMGLKLSIDDFGTGYSSLNYLRQFPVYKLKIDRSFVQAMTVDSDGAVIAATIINMAQSLNLKAIAEGVETEEQMLFLRAHNCDEIQGYYFSKPLAAGDFAEKVRRTALVRFDSSDSCRTAGQPETSIRS